MTQPRRRADGLRKRALLFETAMKLFREKGYEATTMRDIAKEASVAVGSAYHYFPSKAAIVFEFYEHIQAAHERNANRALKKAGDDLEARLRAVFSTKMRLVAKDKELVRHIPSTMQPGNELSVFAPKNQPLRDSSIDLFEKAIEGVDFGEHQRSIATALWVAHLGLMLYLVHDTSPKQKRTMTLTKEACTRMAPLIQLASLPIARPLIGDAVAMLSRAGLVMPKPEHTET